MMLLDIPIGRKIYSLKCGTHHAETIKSLGHKLNQLVNKNYAKYPGMSDENVFLMTCLQILSKLNALEAQKSETTHNSNNEQSNNFETSDSEKTETNKSNADNNQQTSQQTSANKSPNDLSAANNLSIHKSTQQQNNLHINHQSDSVTPQQTPTSVSSQNIDYETLGMIDEIFMISLKNQELIDSIDKIINEM